MVGKLNPFNATPGARPGAALRSALPAGFPRAEEASLRPSRSSRSAARKSRPAGAAPVGELVFPGEEEGWQVWKLANSGLLAPGAALNTPGACRDPAHTLFAWPVRDLFCAPLWINTADESQLAEMVNLQVETRDLGPEAMAAKLMGALAWKKIAVADDRTLVFITLIAPGAAVTAADERMRDFWGYEVSPRCLPFPPNQIVFWKQQGELALTFTRGEEIVYFQGFAESSITEGISKDVLCLQASLFMEQIITQSEGVTCWFTPTTAERNVLQTALALPLTVSDFPAPHFPKPVWSILPPNLSAARIRKKRLLWRGRGLLVLALAYLLFLGASFAQTAKIWFELKKEKDWLSARADDLNTVQTMRGAWQEMSPALDASRFPLERLLLCSQLLPADTMHFTLFDQTGNKLQIKAEAKNAAIAFQFANRLEKTPAFSTMTWQVGQPTVLPNDLAQIQLEGTDAPPQF